MGLETRRQAGGPSTSSARTRPKRSPPRRSRDRSRMPANAPKERAMAGRKMRQMPRDDLEPTRSHLTHSGSRWRARGARRAPPAARGSPGSGPGSGTARAAVDSAPTTAYGQWQHRRGPRRGAAGEEQSTMPEPPSLGVVLADPVRAAELAV